MNKKAVTEMMLVIIVSTIIGAVVFLTVLWPAFSGALKGAQSRGECNWNLFLASAVKAGSFGFAEIEPGCKAQYTTVDSEELKKYHTLANQRIIKYYQKTPQITDFKLDQNGKPTYDAMNEWSLDYVMAKKMTACWDKVWHGKLDFFRQYAGNRSVCVVCDVTTFSEDFPAVLKTKNITTLYDWLNAEPYYQKTYYDYLVEGQTVKPVKEAYIYKTNKPLAITYMHTKDGYWEGLVIGGIAGATVSATTGGAMFGPLGVLPGAIYGAIIGSVSDGADSTKQLFVYPYEDLRKVCTDIIA